MVSGRPDLRKLQLQRRGRRGLDAVRDGFSQAQARQDPRRLRPGLRLRPRRRLPESPQPAGGRDQNKSGHFSHRTFVRFPSAVAPCARNCFRGRPGHAGLRPRLARPVHGPGLGMARQVLRALKAAAAASVAVRGGLARRKPGGSPRRPRAGSGCACRRLDPCGGRSWWTCTWSTAAAHGAGRQQVGTSVWPPAAPRLPKVGSRVILAASGPSTWPTGAALPDPGALPTGNTAESGPGRLCRRLAALPRLCWQAARGIYLAARPR